MIRTIITSVLIWLAGWLNRLNQILVCWAKRRVVEDMQQHSDGDKK